MSRVALLALIAAGVADNAVAQADPHAHHHMHGQHQQADPHAGHDMAGEAPEQADPHAGHDMGVGKPVDPHAGHTAPEPGAAPQDASLTGDQLSVGSEPAPQPPVDMLADLIHGAAAMEQARATLRQEHGGAVLAKMMLDELEVRPDAGADAYAWDAEFRYGDDVDRFVVKTEGEGHFGDGLEEAEVQALYSRAVGPYFDLQAGVRQDLQPRTRRTYAVVGFEGLAPYWFEVEGAVFVSNKGEASARFEASYDLRLTQRLILEPRGEVTLAAQDTRRLEQGSGLSDGEVGLRLRYEVRREFAPYVGINHARKFGDTADYARGAGEGVRDTRFVVGVRAWY